MHAGLAPSQRRGRSKIPFPSPARSAPIPIRRGQRLLTVTHASQPPVACPRAPLRWIWAKGFYGSTTGQNKQCGNSEPCALFSITRPVLRSSPSGNREPTSIRSWQLRDSPLAFWLPSQQPGQYAEIVSTVRPVLSAQVSSFRAIASWGHRYNLGIEKLCKEILLVLGDLPSTTILLILLSNWRAPVFIANF